MEFKVGDFVYRAIGWDADGKPCIWSKDKYQIDELGFEYHWLSDEDGSSVEVSFYDIKLVE